LKPPDRGLEEPDVPYIVGMLGSAALASTPIADMNQHILVLSEQPTALRKSQLEDTRRKGVVSTKLLETNQPGHSVSHPDLIPNAKTSIPIFGDAIDKAINAREHLHAQALDEPWHVLDKHANEQRGEVFGGNFLLDE
jgi:hypothetical protein